MLRSCFVCGFGGFVLPLGASLRGLTSNTDLFVSRTRYVGDLQ